MSTAKGVLIPLGLALILMTLASGMSIGQEVVGPITTEEGIQFTLEAPDAHQVFLAGTFNNWAPNHDLMAEAEDGLWQIVMSLEDGHHQYKFVVDGSWRHDPHNPSTTDDGFGGYNSVLVIQDGEIVAAAEEPGPVMATPIAPPPQKPIYLAIIWHQHQPIYDRDPRTRTYAKPWVRMHAVKDYYDMASILLDYPNVHATFNLVPSLILQLDDFVSGATDRYLELTEKPADQLTPEDREFILRRFFDANWMNLIGVHPGYETLLNKRGRTVTDESIARAREQFTVQDYLDLQVWFNLAWLDPDFKEEEPFRSFIAKDHDFSEMHKTLVLKKHRKIMEQVIPLHRRMQEAGQIEVTTTPFYHPILPLIFDTELALVAMPHTSLPGHFSYPQDARAQVNLGTRAYQEHFGRPPRGMWPAEGSVAQEVVGMVADAGIQWMASDEEVLENSIDQRLVRRGDDLQNPEVLYRPYLVQENGKEVTVIFRDRLLSDKIGFAYSGMPGKTAAMDLINHIYAAARKLETKEGPFLMTLILDGENAWEHYRNDGKEFLHTLYSQLNQDPWIITVTPSEFLDQFGAQERVEKLWAGSWISADFHTWIGEEEENRAWDLLLEARGALENYQQVHGEDLRYRAALENIYAAEGSDWFWWYGDDQNSGDDPSFDAIFRSTLMRVYQNLGQTVPTDLHIPLIPKETPPPDREVSGRFTPWVDGNIEEAEWAKSGYYDDTDSLADPEADIIRRLYYGYDEKNLYLAIHFNRDLEDMVGRDLFVALYLSTPDSAVSNARTRYGAEDMLLGYGLNWELGIDFRSPSIIQLSRAGGEEPWTLVKRGETVGLSGVGVEFSLPFDDVGAKPYDPLRFALVAAENGQDRDYAPSGPVKITVPAAARGQTVLALTDPVGDDNGPGSYVYPTNPVFKPGVFDLMKFTVTDEGDDVIFTARIAGPVENPWGSPIELSVQTLDIYIDTDHQPSSGLTELLPGRNARVAPEDAWEYCLWVEGWQQEIHGASPDEGPRRLGEVKAQVIPQEHTIRVTVPKKIIGDRPQDWGYLVVLTSQEGFPAAGNWRVREVFANAEEYRLGGGRDDHLDPNIIDILVPEGQSQQEILGAYETTGEQVVVPMVRVK
jgi:alpha-amylase/alpha-mannosidase (GH57 family)